MYPHIPDQLLKFRRFTIGMTADISQMFRQIFLDEKDQDLHRFAFVHHLMSQFKTTE